MLAVTVTRPRKPARPHKGRRRRLLRCVSRTDGITAASKNRAVLLVRVCTARESHVNRMAAVFPEPMVSSLFSESTPLMLSWFPAPASPVPRINPIDVAFSPEWVKVRTSNWKRTFQGSLKRADDAPANAAVDIKLHEHEKQAARKTPSKEAVRERQLKFCSESTKNEKELAIIGQVTDEDRRLAVAAEVKFHGQVGAGHATHLRPSGWRRKQPITEGRLWARLLGPHCNLRMSC